jgi:hemolysin D
MPRREDVEFLPPGIGERDTPPSTAAVSLALSIVLAFLIAVGWAYLGTLDVVAVARGRIVPQARVQVVQTAEPGIVRLIGARDGSMVRKGQILLELDPTVSDADESRLTQELAEAKLHVARLEALIADAPRIAAPTAAGAEDVELQQRLLDDQRAEYRRRLEAAALTIQQRSAAVAVTETNVVRLESVVAIQTQRADAFRTLLEGQFIATLQFLEVEERRIDKVQELAMERRRLEQEEAARAEAEAHYDVIESEFRSTRRAELSSWQSRAASIGQEVVKAARRRVVQRIFAPTDGIVQQNVIHTVGAVVAAGQQLMVVVPSSGKLEGEVWIENKDVGFVQSGQTAELKVESFPFTRYGTVPGTVVSVSPDAVSKENAGLLYVARVEMLRDTMDVDGGPVRLIPGMAIAAEIQLGRRRVIEFFLSPLLKRTYEALRER